jgi:5-methylcytosine-specific restriction endonuclease McrA
MSLSKNQISVDKHFMNNVIQEMNKTIEKLYIELDKKDNIIAKQTKEIENQLRVINTANEGVFEKYRINKKDFLYDFQKGNCCYCNRKVSKKKMTKEHLIPKVYDGGSRIGNIALACRKCNERRGCNLTNLRALEILQERAQTAWWQSYIDEYIGERIQITIHE